MCGDGGNETALLAQPTALKLEEKLQRRELEADVRVLPDLTRTADVARAADAAGTPPAVFSVRTATLFRTVAGLADSRIETEETEPE